MRRSRGAHGALAAVLGLVPGLLACGEGFTSADGGTDSGGTEARARDVTAPPKDASEAMKSDVQGSDVGSNESGGRHDAGKDAGSDAGPCMGANLEVDPANCGFCRHKCGTTGTCLRGVCSTETEADMLTNPGSIAVNDAGVMAFSVLGDCSVETPCGQVFLLNLGTTGPATPVASVVASTADASGLPGIPVALDANDVYWASSATPATVMYQQITGSAPSIITPVDAASWVALAVDDKYLYVGESGGTIYHAKTSPSATWTPTWASIANSNSLSALTATIIGSTHFVFWANELDRSMTTGSVHGVSIGTTSPTSWSQTSLAEPISVAASAAGVVWVTEGSSSIQEEAVGMGTIDVIVPTTPMTPSRVVVDEATGALYWTVHAGLAGLVMVLLPGTTTPIILARGQHNPTAIALDATHVYWVNTGTPNMDDGTIKSTWR
jgi:hypothetical protein